MADFGDRDSLESPKKRPRLENNELGDPFIGSINRETSHVSTRTEVNALHRTGDPLLGEKHLLNFDPDSGAGFEHELPSDAINREDQDRVPTHFNNDFLPEQNDLCKN